MGYMRHHAIVVTSWKRGFTEAAAEKAKGLGLGVMLQSGESINGYSTLCVYPDGSKEGWPESDAHDKARNAFLLWLDANRYEDGSCPFDSVEVEFGADGGSAVITADSTIPRPTGIERRG